MRPQKWKAIFWAVIKQYYFGQYFSRLKVVPSDSQLQLLREFPPFINCEGKTFGVGQYLLYIEKKNSAMQKKKKKQASKSGFLGLNGTGYNQLSYSCSQLVYLRYNALTSSDQSQFDVTPKAIQLQLALVACGYGKLFLSLLQLYKIKLEN